MAAATNGGNGKRKRTKNAYVVLQEECGSNATDPVVYHKVFPIAGDAPFEDTSQAMAHLKKSQKEGEFVIAAVTKRVRVTHEKIVKTTVEEF